MSNVDPNSVPEPKPYIKVLSQFDPDLLSSGHGLTDDSINERIADAAKALERESELEKENEELKKAKEDLSVAKAGYDEGKAVNKARIQFFRSILVSRGSTPAVEKLPGEKSSKGYLKILADFDPDALSLAQGYTDGELDNGIAEAAKLLEYFTEQEKRDKDLNTLKEKKKSLATPHQNEKKTNKARIQFLRDVLVGRGKAE